MAALDGEEKVRPSSSRIPTVLGYGCVVGGSDSGPMKDKSLTGCEQLAVEEIRDPDTPSLNSGWINSFYAAFRSCVSRKLWLVLSWPDPLKSVHRE
jgi:hypothetical protein